MGAACSCRLSVPEPDLQRVVTAVPRQLLPKRPAETQGPRGILLQSIRNVRASRLVQRFSHKQQAARWRAPSALLNGLGAQLRGALPDFERPRLAPRFQGLEILLCRLPVRLWRGHCDSPTAATLSGFAAMAAGHIMPRTELQRQNARGAGAEQGLWAAAGISTARPAGWPLFLRACASAERGYTTDRFRHTVFRIRNVNPTHSSERTPLARLLCRNCLIKCLDHWQKYTRAT